MCRDAKEKNTKLEVMVFTDPYCSWCWATEPMILTMMEKYRDQLHFHYVFGGLIKDFDDFYDAQNDIRDAAATKPHWKMVSERTGSRSMRTSGRISRRLAIFPPGRPT